MIKLYDENKANGINKGYYYLFDEFDVLIMVDMFNFFALILTILVGLIAWVNPNKMGKVLLGD